MYSDNNGYFRHSDGSIHFDHYRAEAMALRQHALQESSRLRSFIKFAAAIGILLGMVAVAPSRSTETETTAKRSSISQTASHGAPARPPVF